VWGVWIGMASKNCPHRLDLNELGCYFQRLSSTERFTKYCDYLLQRILNIITEYHHPGTLHGSISVTEKYSSYKSPHDISNEKLYHIVEKVYQFFQKIMKNSWSLRQHIYLEENEKQANLLLQEIDQQLILIVLESDHAIREYEAQKNETIATSGERLWPIIRNLLVLILFLLMFWICFSSQIEDVNISHSILDHGEDDQPILNKNHNEF
jgi:hypothetical protein